MCFCQGFFKGGIFPLNNGKESEFEVKKNNFNEQETECGVTCG